MPTRTHPSPSLLIERALSLQSAARSGRTEPLLRGKHFALVSERQDSDAAERFYRAATELGAQVARIRPSVAGLLDAADVENTARWLGRLYAAVECQDLPAERVEQIRAAAGIPVLDGLGSDGADSGAGETLGDDAEGRRYLLQARLISLFA